MSIALTNPTEAVSDKGNLENYTEFKNLCFVQMMLYSDKVKGDVAFGVQKLDNNKKQVVNMIEEYSQFQKDISQLNGDVEVCGWLFGWKSGPRAGNINFTKHHLWKIALSLKLLCHPFTSNSSPSPIDFASTFLCRLPISLLLHTVPA